MARTKKTAPAPEQEFTYVDDTQAQNIPVGYTIGEEMPLQAEPTPEVVEPVQEEMTFAPETAENALEGAALPEMELAPVEAAEAPESGEESPEIAPEEPAEKQDLPEEDFQATPDAEAETITESDAVSDTEPEEESEDDGPTQVTISIPSAPFTSDAIGRLRSIVASKDYLLKKALGTDNLEIIVEDDKVSFPWFTDHGLNGEMDAYSKLVFALSRLAITQKRVSQTEREKNPDEKLAMRLFLIRLKFIGDEYKKARAILTRNFASSGGYTANTLPEIDFGEVEVIRR